MMKKILLIVLFGALWWVHTNRPTLRDHQEKIYLLANGPESGFDDAELSLPQWDKLEFKDWFLLTATQDKDKFAIVSVGIPRYVRIIDTDWGLFAFGKKTKPD